MKTLLFAASVLISTPALAQDMPPGPPPPPAGGMQRPTQPDTRIEMRADAIARVQRAFAVMDANHDGVIDQAEAAGAESRVQAAARAANGGAAPAAPEGRALGGIGRMLVRADTNKDGKVTLQEATDNTTRHFDMVDTDHDGKTTPEERAAAAAAAAQPAPGPQ